MRYILKFAVSFPPKHPQSANNPKVPLIREPPHAPTRSSPTGTGNPVSSLRLAPLWKGRSRWTKSCEWSCSLLPISTSHMRLRSSSKRLWRLFLSNRLDKVRTTFGCVRDGLEWHSLMHDGNSGAEYKILETSLPENVSLPTVYVGESDQKKVSPTEVSMT